MVVVLRLDCNSKINFYNSSGEELWAGMEVAFTRMVQLSGGGRGKGKRFKNGRH
jgi:hypothetical protein